MQVYHGSPELFTEFDYRRIGTSGTNEGKGFYFTDFHHIAKGYGQKGYLYTVEWTGKKSLSSDSRTITKSQLRKYLKKMDEAVNFLENWGEVSYEGYANILNRAIDGEYNASGNDVDLIAGIANISGDMETALRLVHEVLGYDSIVTRAEWGGAQTIYVALVPEAFRLITVEEVS